MNGLWRALPAVPGEWIRLSSAVGLGMASAGGSAQSSGPEAAAALAAAGRLQRALAPATRRPPPGGLSPALVFVTAEAEDVAALGVAARRLGAGLLPAEPGVSGTAAPTVGLSGRLSGLVWDMALVHALLDLDPGEDGETLRCWGADGPMVVGPPPVAVAAHRRLAARVYALWTTGRRE